MKDHLEPEPGSRRPENSPVYAAREENGFPAGRSNGHFRPNGRPGGPVMTVWTALDLLLHRWHWLVLGLALGGGLFFALGYLMVKPKFTASAQLLRYEPLGKTEYFKTGPVSGDTLAGLIRAPELLRKTSDQAFDLYGLPPMPPETFNKIIKVDPDPDSDMVKVQLAARDPRLAVNLLNLYLTNAVAYTRELESQQMAVLAKEYLKTEVTQMDQDINALQEEFLKRPVLPQMSNKLAEVSGKINAVGTNLATGGMPSMMGFTHQAERLQLALAELNDLLLKYTDLHPAVQAKRAQIAEMESQIAAASTNKALALSGGLGLGGGLAGGRADMYDPEMDIVHIKMRALEDARIDLSKRMREAELYAANPAGNLRLFAPATLRSVATNMRMVKVSLVTIFGAGLGLVASLGLVLLVELVDRRLKTPEDLQRVTHLPVLTTLGDLQQMDPLARSRWAFRAWTLLQGRLSPSANHGLICGITSATHGEGRSTWLSLLAEAASLTGFRVLTIATRPSPSHVEADDHPQEFPNGKNGNGSHMLTTSALSTPAKVTEQLTGPNSQPVVHIPLPGWVWNLDRRKEWRDALGHWSKIENLVILVELPPAEVPEAVLLGASLPNMVWLANSGADAGETRAHLQTLRDARCHLVGAVLNRAPGLGLNRCFPRWVSCLAVLTALGLFSAHAQDSNTVPPAPASPVVSSPATNPAPETNAVPEESGPQTNRTFSIIHPWQRASWQQHLTLGPGDVLTFNLYGQPELTRTEVAIGPDGRVSFLEAQDVPASGLTVDELRNRLDQALGQYRRAPRTMITPVAFKSKKYYMLGKVTTKGVFVLDRPLTVLEALGRAHGLESALVDRNVVDLADFRHSFLARGGKRYPLNFEKLFQQGDLSQNIAIEPNDYIYFAPGDLREVYVVGEIRLPGPVSYYPGLTVVGAITARGGYTERAFKMRVLVVRGSLNAPSPIIVDTHAVLDGRGFDFKLQPGDIVYVNSRPFIKVEEAADLAATAFIQSVVSSWVGVDVVKPF